MNFLFSIISNKNVLYNIETLWKHQISVYMAKLYGYIYVEYTFYIYLFSSSKRHSQRRNVIFHYVVCLNCSHRDRDCTSAKTLRGINQC